MWPKIDSAENISLNKLTEQCENLEKLSKDAESKYDEAKQQTLERYMAGDRKGALEAMNV